MILPEEYNSKKEKKHNIFLARKKIFSSPNNNLNFLLKKRFGWMKKHLKNKKYIIELGSGNGCIKKILKNEKIILTDVTKYKWIDKKVDMLNINLGKKYYNKVDVFILNHALHHCPNPAKTLNTMLKYLKKNGLILINEPEASFFLRVIQIILKDEGWSFKKDVFDLKINLFKKNHPWFSNTAIANMLFMNSKKFTKNFPRYKIKKNELSEFFIFLNSSGVNAKIAYLPFNISTLKLIDIFDGILIKLLPKIFALNRSVILQKNY
tara:strand:- start:13 stop:807 length:795 start_codon:yes stop_codon:yes gene_type:complete